jgi:hypothetical protein
MASKNLSYIEAIEQFPIYTSNSYNLLENLEDFPSLTAANYAKTLKNNKRKSFTLKNNNKNDYEKPKKVREDIDININNRYYESLMIKDVTVGPIPKNPHSVSEFERFQSSLNTNEINTENMHDAYNLKENEMISSPLNTLENMQYSNEAIINEIFPKNNIL